ncbi:hypothetical protein [Phytohabitans houttuyneae]|uniref:hypothetical protein n=1 Tax=Phytohabitans houttuyneae TaxID=1076126 RepID=UPI001567AED8|nr:hypothetical protein [Phytohabitans houttuyneae]
MALDQSGLPLCRSMTVEQIVAAAAAGVAAFGYDSVRARDARILELNRSMIRGTLALPEYDKQRRKLVTGVRRFGLANDLAHRVGLTGPAVHRSVAVAA